MSNCLFYDYIDAGGINIIKTQLDGLGSKVKATFTARLIALEQMNQADWKWPMIEMLKGDKDGLLAVRAKCQRIQHRLLGYYGPYRGECTLLAYCTERDGKYIPLSSGDTAFNRITEIQANPTARRIRHDFG